MKGWLDGKVIRGLFRSRRLPWMRAEALSRRLEVETLEAREQAEQGLFHHALFFGGWGTSLYARCIRAHHYVAYLGQLRIIYAALEQELDRRRSPPAAFALALPEVRRARALEADLASFRGERAQEPEPGLAAQLHVIRLRELGAEAPHLLLAHAYARIASDILPGPLLAARMARAFDLEAGPGTLFYRAVPAGELDRFRARMDAQLDEVDLDEAALQDVVKEARLAFRLQALLGNELARDAAELTSPAAAA